MAYPEARLPTFPINYIGLSALTVNASNIYRGLKIVPTANKTVNSFRVYIGTVTGTVTNALRVELAEQTSRFASNPAAFTVLETKTITPTANSWNDVTGFTTAITKNKTYSLTVSNAAGTPASNNFQVALINIAHPIQFGTSGTSGTSLGGMSSQVSGIVGYSDSTYFGSPFSVLDTANSTYGIYSTREAGQQFTTYAKVSAVGLYFGQIPATGTPTGNPRLRLYTGSSPTLVETVSDLYQMATSSALYYGFFSSPIAIDSGTVVGITFGETTNSDTSSNAFRPWTLASDSGTAGRGTVPYSNKILYYDGSSWTTSQDVHIFQCGLLLENGNEFPSSGGSTGVSRSRLFGGELG